MSCFIDSRRERFGVEPVCRTLDVSASAYYQRATCARSARAVEDERLRALIRQVHRENYSAMARSASGGSSDAAVWTSAATGWRT